MKNNKTHYRIIKAFVLIFIVSGSLFSQTDTLFRNYVIHAVKNVVISANAGIITYQSSDYGIPIKESGYWGLNADFPVLKSFIRIQYNQRSTKKESYYNKSSQHYWEALLTIVRKVYIGDFNLGFGGGIRCSNDARFGYGGYYSFPISIEAGARLNNLFGCAIELRKNVLVTESAYFMGFRFEYKPF